MLILPPALREYSFCPFPQQGLHCGSSYPSWQSKRHHTWEDQALHAQNHSQATATGLAHSPSNCQAGSLLVVDHWIHGHMLPFQAFSNTVLVSYDSLWIHWYFSLKLHFLQLALTSRAQTPLSISKYEGLLISNSLSSWQTELSGSLSMQCNQRWFS